MQRDTSETDASIDSPWLGRRQVFLLGRRLDHVMIGNPGDLCAGCEKAFRMLLQRDVEFDWRSKGPRHIDDPLHGTPLMCTTCRFFRTFTNEDDFSGLALTIGRDPELTSSSGSTHKLELIGAGSRVVFRICHVGDIDSPFVYYPRRLNLRVTEAKKWHQDCSDKHSGCAAKNAQPLPSRLIDVGGTFEQPKLVNTAGQVGTCTALSYCWGDQKPLVTDSSNMAAHFIELPFATLPQLFQDAVTVTRTIGLPYLWIDALCIVQNSKEDWNVECAQMDQTYSNAALTTAVREASDATTGFLSPYSVATPAHVDFVIPSADDDGHVSVRIEKEALDTSYHYNVLQQEIPCKLDRRGWTFQERLLSTRVLEFANSEMSFSCNSSSRSNHMRFPVLPNSSSKDLVIRKNALVKPRLGEVFNAWAEIVEHHSTRSLTYGDDKLPSLSGIARLFQRERTKDTYLAGLWKKDITRGLAWRRDGKASTSQHPAQNESPSWSWASCHFPVQFMVTHAWGISLLVQLNSSEIGPLGTNAFGQLRHGVLHLRGYLAPLASTHASPWLRTETLMDRPTSIPEEDHSATNSNRLGRQVYSLLLVAGNGFSPTDWYALIVEPIEHGSKSFRRLGVHHIHLKANSSDGVTGEDMEKMMMSGGLTDIRLV